jgi:excisionase family DNA binding protein
MKHGEVLRLKDVASLLKVGVKTVYALAQSGELPAFKVRGQWRFTRADIDAWIEKQKRTAQKASEGEHD